MDSGWADSTQYKALAGQESRLLTVGHLEEEGGPILPGSERVNAVPLTRKEELVINFESMLFGLERLVSGMFALSTVAASLSFITFAYSAGASPYLTLGLGTAWSLVVICMITCRVNAVIPWTDTTMEDLQKDRQKDCVMEIFCYTLLGPCLMKSYKDRRMRSRFLENQSSPFPDQNLGRKMTLHRAFNVFYFISAMALVPLSGFVAISGGVWYFGIRYRDEVDWEGMGSGLTFTGLMLFTTVNYILMSFLMGFIATTQMVVCIMSLTITKRKYSSGRSGQLENDADY